MSFKNFIHVDLECLKLVIRQAATSVKVIMEMVTSRVSPFMTQTGGVLTWVSGGCFNKSRIFHHLKNGNSFSKDTCFNFLKSYLMILFGPI